MPLLMQLPLLLRLVGPLLGLQVRPLRCFLRRLLLLRVLWGVSSSVVPVQLFWYEPGQLYCKGMIGNSDEGRFCCKLDTDCTFKSHNAKRATLVEGHLYIRSVKNQFQAKREPSLDPEWLSEGAEQVQKLLDQSNPVGTWATYFWACRHQINQSVESPSTPLKSDGKTVQEISKKRLTDSDVPDLSIYKRAVEDFYTPKCIKLGESERS